jgi:hypothetical protein
MLDVIEDRGGGRGHRIEEVLDHQAMHPSSEARPPYRQPVALSISIRSPASSTGFTGPPPSRRLATLPRMENAGKRCCNMDEAGIGRNHYNQWASGNDHGNLPNCGDSIKWRESQLPIMKYAGLCKIGILHLRNPACDVVILGPRGSPQERDVGQR